MKSWWLPKRDVEQALLPYSGFTEVLLFRETSSVRIIKWLTQLFARYGNPDSLLTDNGPQFVSDEFRDFLRNRDV